MSLVYYLMSTAWRCSTESTMALFFGNRYCKDRLIPTAIELFEAGLRCMG